jgi:DNA mismatch repair protein MutS2
VSTFSEKTARDLSWALLLQDLGTGCFTEQGVLALSRSLPLSDQALALERHELVEEALALEALGEPLPIQAFPDLDACWEHVAKGGTASGRELRDCAVLLSVAENLRKHLQKHAAVAPKSRAHFATDPALGEVLTAIRRAIDDGGEILDSASPELGAARRRRASAQRDLRQKQQSLVNQYSDLLSGQFFAEREGRYVLPVRSDSMGRIEGLVLGSSGSGGTLYVEPRELTPLCNRLRVEEARVLEEEEKILAELTGRVREQLPAVEHAAAVCVDADVVRSVARWADQNEARPIRFHDDAVLDLKAFRHPLLLGKDNTVVPNDIHLAAGHCLILSGPNAGGKTVALKCLGLAVWMARCGFPLPCAAESAIGWFDEVVTDIGDEQSLSRSLSTFSAHMTHISRALDSARPRCLVLLDELASGTDPDEGAALACAVLQAFVERGAAVCVTTHYERLKRLGASEDARFQNASVGFDVKALRPTFRLALGIPGMSAAFAVATRYGIPESVVEYGRELMPKAQLEQQRVIEQLESERQRLSEAREVSEREAHAATRLREQMQRERERAYEQERQRLRTQASELMLEVKQARSLLGQARKLLTEKKPEKQLLKEVEQLIGEAAAPVTVGGSFEKAVEEDTGTPLPVEMLVPGRVVYIPHLKTQGEVVDAPGKGGVRVAIGGLRMLVPVERLREAKPNRPKVSDGKKKRQQTAEPARDKPVRNSENTCDLRGVRVEEGLQEVERFVDRLFRTNEFAAFILHGHGTGAMKAAVRDYLASAPHIAHFEAAAKEDGGDGLTIFWLRG